MDEVYVDYEYYTSVYGGKLPQETFEDLVKEQCRNLDIPTFYRLQDDNYTKTDEDWDKVKYCLCEMIDAQNKFNEKQNANGEAIPDGIKQENIDGYSKTYLTPAEQEAQLKTFEADISKLIRGRIGVTGLLFRGEC